MSLRFLPYSCLYMYLIIYLFLRNLKSNHQTAGIFPVLLAFFCCYHKQKLFHKFFGKWNCVFLNTIFHFNVKKVVIQFNCQLHYLTPWIRVLLEKLTVTHLVKKLPNLYGTRNFIRVHKSPPLVPVPSKPNPVHIFQPYIPKNHSNIVFPSTLTSCDWYLPSYIPTNICMHFSILPCVLRVLPILSSFTW
jgi:hypothetical protein